MRKLLLTALLVLGLGATAAIPAGAGQPQESRRDRPAPPFLVIGLTEDQTLVAFASTNPTRPTTLGPITGLQGDQRLVGIDCRVTDSTAYGVGDAGGIYTLGLRDATATKVSQLTVPLSGRAFDVDFNPAANRLRVISDSGQNLRHNLDDPTGTRRRGSPSPTRPDQPPGHPTHQRDQRGGLLQQRPRPRHHHPVHR
jgi:hypothetical protein